MSHQVHEVTWQMTLCGQLILKANGAQEHLSCIQVLTAYKEEYGLPQNIKLHVAYVFLHAVIVVAKFAVFEKH